MMRLHWANCAKLQEREKAFREKLHRARLARLQDMEVAFLRMLD